MLKKFFRPKILIASPSCAPVNILSSAKFPLPSKFSSSKIQNTKKKIRQKVAMSRNVYGISDSKNFLSSQFICVMFRLLLTEWDTWVKKEIKLEISLSIRQRRHNTTWMRRKIFEYEWEFVEWRWSWSREEKKSRRFSSATVLSTMTVWQQKSNGSRRGKGREN